MHSSMIESVVKCSKVILAFRSYHLSKTWRVGLIRILLISHRAMTNIVINIISAARAGTISTI